MGQAPPLRGGAPSARDGRVLTRAEGAPRRAPVPSQRRVEAPAGAEEDRPRHPHDEEGQRRRVPTRRRRALGSTGARSAAERERGARAEGDPVGASGGAARRRGRPCGSRGRRPWRRAANDAVRRSSQSAGMSTHRPTSHGQDLQHGEERPEPCHDERRALVERAEEAREQPGRSRRRRRRSDREGAPPSGPTAPGAGQRASAAEPDVEDDRRHEEQEDDGPLREQADGHARAAHDRGDEGTALRRGKGRTARASHRAPASCRRCRPCAILEREGGRGRDRGRRTWSARRGSAAWRPT